MAAPKGHPRYGGRQKGTPNKRTLVEEIAAKYSLDVLDVLFMVAMGDWKALGFDAPTKTTFTAQGIEVEELNVKLSDRVQAAKEACKYVHSQKRALEVSSSPEGIMFVFKDYTTAKKDAS